MLLPFLLKQHKVKSRAPQCRNSGSIYCLATMTCERLKKNGCVVQKKIYIYILVDALIQRELQEQLGLSGLLNGTLAHRLLTARLLHSYHGVCFRFGGSVRCVSSLWPRWMTTVFR
jgi:hypothetical protein